MAKRTRRNRTRTETFDTAGTSEEAAAGEGGWRDRLELYLFLAVEILCLLLFIDFLFIGYYVK